MSLEFIQLQSYTAPSIIEQKNKDWVQYGDDNNYYQYLIDLYHSSPTNNACIKGIADQIFGKGLEVTRASRDLPGYIEFKKLFHADDIRAVVMDLKMLGQASFQLVKSKDRKKYVMAKHFPQQTLRPAKCNDKGEIEKYYYCPDWANIKRNHTPKEFRAFGYDQNANECILTIKPYSTGSFYFAPVDYQGGTQYANLEAEISNFHINNIMNGLAPSMLINFNNGQPPAEVKDTIEAQIKQKFGGSSNAGRFIISWNDGQDSKADITPVQLSDAHNQYQFLSGEAMQKIMVAHRIVSPLLLGIKDNTGFGNNADELKSASILFDNVVIRPFQRLIIDAVTKVLNYNGYALNLYFKTLQPLEFTDLSGNVIDDETREEETGVSLSTQKKKIELVKPNAGESEDDFLGRCIPIVVKEGKDTDQATAICYSYFEGNQIQLESYTDYPEGAKSNAKKALEWAEKNGWGDCGTPVGKARANQLANGEPISRETIARMAAFRRHQQNKDVPYSEGCGGLMWDAWGGDAGIRWAESKLKELNLSSDKVSFDYDDTLSTERGKKLAQKEIQSGKVVYIISARDSKDGMLEVASMLGIPNSHVYATGSNKAKIEKVKELGISKHYDNNSDVVNALETIGVQFEMNDKQTQDWLQHLKGKGETINTDEWELIDVREVTDADEEMKFNLAYENPDKRSDDDKGVYKIRYRYGPDFISNNSRLFCTTMVEEAKSGVIYRREDIIQMEDAGVNGQFAPSGQSSYSIWKYKGGVNCHHRWERLTFRRKQIKGKFLPKQPNEMGENRDLSNYDEVSNKSADKAGVPFSPSGWDKAKTRPIDMPNKGSLKNK
jgi:hypothetical protein